MNKAIFFDRDGVLIEAPVIDGFPKSIKNLKDLILCHDIEQICHFFKSKNFYLIMVTNQPDAVRGHNSKENIIEINNYLKKKLNLDDVFVCFCSNDDCVNRKPNPGMIFKAQKKYNLNLNKSYFIGDRWRDIGASKSAKCNSILIDRNYNEKMIFDPDFVIKEIREIFDIINV